MVSLEIENWEDEYRELLGIENPDWLVRWSQLEKKLRSLETELRHAHYADTSNNAAQTAFDQLYQDLLPRLEQSRQALKRRFLEEIDDPSLETIRRDFAAEQRLYCEQNRDLIGKHKILVNRFAGLMSQLEVSLSNKVVTIGQALGHLDNPNRALREEAWRGIWASRLKAHDSFDQLYLDQLKLRETIAHNAGFPTYREYRWLERRRFDYTPQNCEAFANGVREHVLPLLTKVREWKRHRLGLESLRPWDAGMDPFGEAPLRPFEDLEDLLRKATKVFAEMDMDVAQVFNHFLQYGTLDLETRKPKALTVYADFYYDQQEALLFMQADGKPQDLRNFFHEFGHVLHHYLSCTQPLYWSQTVPMEFMEVAAQGMELLMLPWLDIFYPKQDHDRIIFGLYEGILAHLAFIPVLDLFQHWVYSQPADSISVNDLDSQYSKLAAEFMVGLDYKGLEAQQAKGWYFNHLFWQPFYYIEYGFAWVAALDLLRSFRQYPGSILEAYKAALSIGNAPLGQLYSRVGSSFPPSEADLKRVVDFVSGELRLR